MVRLNDMLRIATIIFFGCHSIVAYRILGIFPFNSKSHSFALESLMANMATRRHTVDVIAHYRMNNPPENYNVVVNLGGSMKNFMYNMTADRIAKLRNDPLKVYATKFGNDLCEIMGLPKMQDFIQNLTTVEKPYDIVVTEAFAANCFLGFGHFLDVPVIGVTVELDEYPWVNAYMGNGVNLALASTAHSLFEEDMDFWERLTNLLSYHYSVYRFNSLTEEAQTAAMRKYLRPDMPNVREIEKTVSLILVNSHLSIHDRSPMSSSIVQIGGMHIDSNLDKPTQRLTDWMENSTQGFIYINLGSSILIETLPEETILELYAVFEKISPIRVLIKVLRSKMLPPGLPENVLTMRSIPQVGALRHAHSKLFVTNGDLTGIIEAHYCGIPMIGIPYFDNEIRIIKTLVAMNKAIMIDHREITRETVYKALTTILYDSTYMHRMTMKNATQKFRDQNMSPSDHASYFIEYVVRHGPNSFRTHSGYMPWYQKAQIDIYGFLAICIITSMWILFFILSTIIRYAFAAKPKKSPKKSEKERETPKKNE